MTDTRTDAELVGSAKAGNLQAFELLVNRHQERIYTLALRMLRHEQDAEDVTQQAFMNALEHLQDFREEAGFGTWITRIATFAALKLIRKHKGLPTISLDQQSAPAEDSNPLPHPEFIADWSQSPDDLAQHAEVRQVLDRALATVEEKLRLVFLLRDVEGLSVRETAEALQISEANVKVRLLRARLQLREVLTRQFGDPARVLMPHAH